MKILRYFNRTHEFDVAHHEPGDLDWCEKMWTWIFSIINIHNLCNVLYIQLCTDMYIYIDRK